MDCGKDTLNLTSTPLMKEKNIYKIKREIRLDEHRITKSPFGKFLFYYKFSQKTLCYPIQNWKIGGLTFILDDYDIQVRRSILTKLDVD